MTDTAGLLVGAVVHPADIRDRDGAGLVIEAVHSLFPWLRHLFADSAYAGDKLLNRLAEFGHWTIELVKRPAAAAGFRLLPRRWVVERTLAWLSRNRRLAKGLRGLTRQCYRLDLHCFYATPRPAACIDTTITILSRTLSLPSTPCYFSNCANHAKKVTSRFRQVRQRY